MSMTHVQKIKWAGTLQAIAQESSIIATLTDGKYKADASGSKIVRVCNIGTPSITNYVPGTITYPLLADSEIDILLNQKKVWSFGVDDIETSQTDIEYVNEGTTRAGNLMALTADKYAWALYGDAGYQINDGVASPSTGALPVNSSNVVEVLQAATQYFDEHNVPIADRNLIVEPWFKNKMVLAKLNRETPLGDSVYMNGFVGDILGFKVYMSNQLTAGHQLALSSRAIAYADQINKVESVRLIDTFGDGVRGLFTFGAKTMFEDELIDIWAETDTE